MVLLAMAEIEHIEIEIEDDFMARQTRAEPVQALAELIWNSVDADANRVVVEFEFKDLAQGMSKIVVYDDGHGIPRNQAKLLFGHLGGSWKRMKRRTESKDRMVHGPRRSRSIQGFCPRKGSGLEGLLPFAGAIQIIHNLSSRKRPEGRSDFRRTERSRTKPRRDRRNRRSKARFRAPSF